jgi:hypothetical protein
MVTSRELPTRSVVRVGNMGGTSVEQSLSLSGVPRQLTSRLEAYLFERKASCSRSKTAISASSSKIPRLPDFPPHHLCYPYQGLGFSISLGALARYAWPR